MVEEPNVIWVVDIEAMVYFEKNKNIRPSCANLSSDVNPKSFNTDVVHTPKGK